MSHFLQEKIIVLDNVLTKRECKKIIEFYNSKISHIRWGSSYSLPIDMNDQFLMSKVTKIEAHINLLLQNNIKTDWSQIVKWPIDSSQQVHYDMASDRTVFTSVTYLNDDYDGGETFILDDIKIVPKIGRTVYFDGQFYKHGVSCVKNRDRYTLPIWYKKKVKIITYL